MILFFLFVSFFSADAQQLPTIPEKTIGLQKMNGFFTLYHDDRLGKLWMEVDRFDQEF